MDILYLYIMFLWYVYVFQTWFDHLEDLWTLSCLNFFFASIGLRNHH